MRPGTHDLRGYGIFEGHSKSHLDQERCILATSRLYRVSRQLAEFDRPVRSQMVAATTTRATLM